MMVDLTSILYGVLGTIGTLALFKIIDIVLERLLDRTLFSRIWTVFSKSLKKFHTRWNPIMICFQFSTKTHPNEPTKIKETLTKLVRSLSEKHEDQITFSPLTWTETDRMGSLNATFNKRDFRINMHICSEYVDFEPEKGLFDSYKDASEISDSIAFSIEVSFPFRSIEPMLLSLASLTNFISEQAKEILPIVRFSKGLFTVAPIKADFTMNHWIKEKQFDVSLLLKARENIMVNLYPTKAEIVFSSLQIDERVSEYLKGTILNYYL